MYGSRAGEGHLAWEPIGEHLRQRHTLCVAAYTTARIIINRLQLFHNNSRTIWWKFTPEVNRIDISSN